MLKSNREEIERILQHGADILSGKPELADMDLEEVLNILDDGTSAMLQDRWGVVARIICTTITDFSSDALVLELAKYKDIGFTCEYVGYLLFTNYGTDLESLLLEADRQEVLDKIVPFVYPNVQYNESLCLERFCEVCTMLNSHVDTREYQTLISTYVDYIENHQIYSEVVQSFNNLAGQSQYDIMRKIANTWYHHACQEASETTEKLLTYDSLWSKKAGLDFLETSLQYGTSDFLKAYTKVETMIEANQSLWISAIPLFVQALSIDVYDDRECTAFTKILSKLNTIPEGSLEERRQFISPIQWKGTIHEDIEPIFRRIISLPFGKDNDILHMLDIHFYISLNKHIDSAGSVLKRLYVVFSANNYRIDYDKFFDALPSTQRKLTEFSSEATEAALNYLLIGGKSQFFFGLGLLKWVGNITKLYQERESSHKLNANCLTEEQIIRIMKGILYFSFDAKYVCRTSFLLLLLAGRIGDIYYQFCIDEIFANYPGTMRDVSRQFKSSKNKRYVLLAAKVENAGQEATKAYTIGRQIQDISPSYNHLRIYQHAQSELMRQSEERKGPSFLDALFPKRILKYGAKIAFIMKGTKGELHYKVTSPARISATMELPTTNTDNPVDFTLKRLAYLDEVQMNATNT